MAKKDHKEGEILISVVIPVKNGQQTLERCLKGIFSQTLSDQTEVIVVDSGSTDLSLEIIKQFPIKIIQIPSHEFNHGATRNLGVSNAIGKYVVLTVQDAIPADSHWLEELLKGFVNEKVAGVCGQQVVPHEKDKNPIEWHRPISGPSLKTVSFKSREEFDQLSPAQQKSACAWDDVTAAYRRDIFMNHPFRPVTFAEDAIWARDILQQGYTLVYNNAAKVFHYHDFEPKYAFLRVFTVHYSMYSYFKFIPGLETFSLKRFLSHIHLLLFKSPGTTFFQKIRWLYIHYKQIHSYNKTTSFFLKVLNRGEDELNRAHFRYCGVPPQPKTFA